MKNYETTNEQDRTRRMVCWSWEERPKVGARGGGALLTVTQGHNTKKGV